MCLGIAGCIACEACSCACGACKCLGKMAPGNLIGGRVGYVAMFLFFSLLAWVFRGYAAPLLDWIPSQGLEKVCGDGKSDWQDRCFSIYTIYRVSFVLAVFHVVLGLFMIGASSQKDFRWGVQEGGWLWKVLAVAAMVVGSLFVPTPFFIGYGYVAFGGAALFIIVQLLLLVDFAHSWAESWIEKYEEDQMETDGSQKWWYALLGTSLLAYSACIGGSIAMYVFFSKDPSCGLNTMAITLNLVIGVIMAALSCHPRVQEASPRSGLLQSAIVSTYMTYLVYSALMSGPRQECNPAWDDMMKKDAQGNITIALGALFTLVAVVYSAIRTASSDFLDGGAATGTATSGLAATADETRPLTATAAADDDDVETGKRPGMATGDDDAAGDVVDDGYALPYNLSRFHLIFVLGACYIGMLFTDWGAIDSTGQDTAAVDMGPASFWVKVISGWVCAVFYCWTLGAPLLFPNRDWN